MTLHSSLRPFGWCVVLLLLGSALSGCVTSPPMCSTGYCTYTYANGDKYFGGWKDKKQHGQGTYTFASGGKYVGEWKEGKRNGLGIDTKSTNRQVLEGRFLNDNLVERIDLAERRAKLARDKAEAKKDLERRINYIDGKSAERRAKLARDKAQLKKYLEEQILESRKDGCTNFGFAPNSDAHAQCVMQLFIAEEKQAAAAAQAARVQAAIRAQQAAQAAAAKEAEDYDRKQRQSEILMRMGQSISRGCGLAGC